MNPFEEPLAHLQPPIEFATPQKMNWFAIFAAGGVHVIVSIICTTILGALSIVLDGNSPSLIVAILTPLPWIAAPAYLAKKVKYRWVVHGLVYSLIPTFVLLVFTAGVTPLDEMAASVLTYMVPLQLFSIVITLATMAIVRHFLRKSKRS